MNFKIPLIIVLLIFNSCSLYQNDQLSEEKQILRDILPGLIDYSLVNKDKEEGNILLFAEIDSNFVEVIKNGKLPHCKDQISGSLEYEAVLADINNKEYEWKISDLEFIKDHEIIRYDPLEHDQMNKDKVIGIFGVSRIYFDRENEKGVIYYSFACGSYCGFEAVYFLENIDGKWEIADQCEFGIP